MVKYTVTDGNKDLPTYMLVDDKQLLLLIRKDDAKKKVAALWTNYAAFIKALKALFIELWRIELKTARV